MLSVVERLSLSRRLSWKPRPSILDLVGVAYRYLHVDIVKEDAKRASVDKETELEVIQDCTPLSKVEIRAEIAQLQKNLGVVVRF